MSRICYEKHASGFPFPSLPAIPVPVYIIPCVAYYPILMFSKARQCIFASVASKTPWCAMLYLRRQSFYIYMGICILSLGFVLYIVGDNIEGFGNCGRGKRDTHFSWHIPALSSISRFPAFSLSVFLSIPILLLSLQSSLSTGYAGYAVEVHQDKKKKDKKKRKKT